MDDATENDTEIDTTAGARRAAPRMPTPAGRVTAPVLRRRRYVYLNRLEDVSPGRLAFAVHRSRRETRRRMLRSYGLLNEWLARRAALVADEAHAEHGAASQSPTTADESLDNTTVDERASDDLQPATADRTSGSPVVDADIAPDDGESSDRPTEDWTKGRLYDMAREYEIEGRSKLNKAELLDAVTDAWNASHN